MKNTDLYDLSDLILPTDLTAYFEIVDIIKESNSFHIYLDERSDTKGHEGLLSKGFTEAKTIQDFPLRGKPVFLHVRRRKWLNQLTNEVSSIKYDLSYLGTQLSKEFADFLKGTHRV